jgi:hypothetical protein
MNPFFPLIKMVWKFIRLITGNQEIIRIKIDFTSCNIPIPKTRSCPFESERGAVIVVLGSA